MIDITLNCYVAQNEGLIVKPDDIPGGIRVTRIDGAGGHNWFSPDDTRRLYDALGAHLGVTPAEPAEPAALTRIAVALEALAPVADALTKLASYATEDGLTESARIP